MKKAKKLNDAGTQALNIPVVISSAISEMEKKINEYKKAAQNAVDEFDDTLNYGKSRAMQEAIEILKKHCL